MDRELKRVKREPCDGEIIGEIIAHDTEDYNDLCARYYNLVSARNPPRHARMSTAYRRLRERIQEHLRLAQPREVHRLLRQLRDFETNPASLGGVLHPGSRGRQQDGGEVAEMIDLTDDKVIVDLDTFIIDVVLLKVVKPDPDVPSTSTARPSGPAIKCEPTVFAGCGEQIRAPKDRTHPIVRVHARARTRVRMRECV